MVMAWALAIIITLAAGWYQRVTGPSHPLKVNAGINGKSYVFVCTCFRSHYEANWYNHDEIRQSVTVIYSRIGSVAKFSKKSILV